MRPLHEVLIEAATRQGVSMSTRRSALALAAAAPAAFGLNTVLGQVEAEKQGRQKKRNQKRRNRDENKRNNDRKNGIEILNNALTLEHLEYAFYRDGLAQFQASDFSTGVFAKLIQIRDHEDTHVDALTETIESLGGNPVEELCYNFDALDGQGDDFDFQDPDGFLDIARLLEDTGVMAYTGAIAAIKSASLQTTGATIATVEARHASYLRLLVLNDPFPQAFDEPKSMEEILEAAGGFIEGPMPCEDDNGE